MKANKWVAVLATGSMLAVAAPVSAQFGGLGSLKKKLETVAKELEKPKPAPQPQPTARPTPPQSRPATSQGGYASPAPQPRQRTEQVQTPIQYQPSAVQQARVAPKREVVATEIWRCLQEPDATPIKLEFNYVRDEAGQRLGSFTQTYTYEYEGKETEPPTISKGIFRSAGASYRLKYDDPELGQIELVASQKDSENGTILSTSRYTEDYPSMRDVETITQKFTDAQIKMFEATADDNPDGGIPLQCKLIKPIFSKYSFDDFYVDRPTAFFEGFREDPKQPQFAGRDINFRNIRTMLSEAVTNHWYTPKFGKYFIVVSGGKHMAQYAYLIDMRSGKVHELFMETIEGGGVLDYKITENSNMVLSITADPEKNYCNLNYSKWNGSALELIQTERLGAFQTCLNEYGTFPQPNYLQAIEDQYLQRNFSGKTQANAEDAAPPEASAPSENTFATPTNRSASILGKWIPSDSDELYENQRTITRNGIEGYEWECEFTPPISDFQRYSGTEECTSVDGESGSASSEGSEKILIELLDADTIQYSKNGAVKQYWKRSNIEE